jgi:LysM repeat protein
MKKYLILFFISFYSFAGTHFPDSLGVENEGGNTIILHKVDPKETLFSISRRYKVSVDAIKNMNKGVENGLSVGQTLRIPYKGMFREERTVNNGLDLAMFEKPKTEKNKTHKVGPKETLFSISKQYNVSVDDIKKWNNLTSNELKLDQELIINPSSNAPITTSAPVTTTETRPVTNTNKDTKPALSGENKQVVTQMGSYEKITQKGAAETMTESHDQTKYLCLHKTANLGTIIQVKNEANGSSVFVRVIGKLPDVPENNGIIIKLSTKAAERLEVESKQYAVEISYIP